VAGKVKTWVWVVVGIAAVGVLLVMAGAAAGVYFFASNIDAKKATPAAAASEFDGIRTRFAGQKPLIELDNNGNFLRSNTDRPAPENASMPDALHILAYDPDDGGLVNMRVPFWLLRLKVNDTKINFGGNSMNLEDLKLTVEDLERFGPTLVLDQRNDGGDRILVWSQ
jgi:hypothetical protein